LRITSVTAYPVWIGFRNQLLVKIETDEDGIFGWGESGLSSRELAVEGALRHIGEFLVGQDPMQRGRIWQEIYRSQYFEGDRVLTAAMSAIDIALHDLVGKKLGVPVYDLLGGRQREWIPTFATTHSTSVEEAVEQAKLLADRGWNCIRLGIVEGAESDVFEPREAIAVSAEACIRVREALGNSIVLGIDFHHRLSVAEAASFCQMMPPHTLDFLEEPIRDECPDAYEQLRRLTPIPFAIGEEFASKWAFMPYVERGLTEFARIDVCNVGGLTESMKVAGWCEAHYIDLMPHNPLGPICSAATAHVAAAVPNFSWLEIRESPTEPGGDFYPVDVFPVQPELADGRLTLHDVPGLGVEVNEEALGEAFRPSEMPHLRRADGSVTNW
jgi:galactonate dehydratase